MPLPMGRVDELPTPVARIIGELVAEYKKNYSPERREQLLLTVRAVLHFMVPEITYETATAALQEINKQIQRTV